MTTSDNSAAAPALRRPRWSSVLIAIVSIIVCGFVVSGFAAKSNSTGEEMIARAGGTMGSMGASILIAYLIIKFTLKRSGRLAIPIGIVLGGLIAINGSSSNESAQAKFDQQVAALKDSIQFRKVLREHADRAGDHILFDDPEFAETNKPLASNPSLKDLQVRRDVHRSLMAKITAIAPVFQTELNKRLAADRARFRNDLIAMKVEPALRTDQMLGQIDREVAQSFMFLMPEMLQAMSRKMEASALLSDHLIKTFGTWRQNEEQVFIFDQAADVPRFTVLANAEKQAIDDVKAIVAKAEQAQKAAEQQP